MTRHQYLTFLILVELFLIFIAAYAFLTSYKKSLEDARTKLALAFPDITIFINVTNEFGRGTDLYVQNDNLQYMIYLLSNSSENRTIVYQGDLIVAGDTVYSSPNFTVELTPYGSGTFTASFPMKHLGVNIIHSKFVLLNYSHELIGQDTFSITYDVRQVGQENSDLYQIITIIGVIASILSIPITMLVSRR
jgi:hypothetical protein